MFCIKCWIVVLLEICITKFFFPVYCSKKGPKNVHNLHHWVSVISTCFALYHFLRVIDQVLCLFCFVFLHVLECISILWDLLHSNGNFLSHRTTKRLYHLWWVYPYIVTSLPFIIMSHLILCWVTSAAETSSLNNLRIGQSYLVANPLHMELE